MLPIRPCVCFFSSSIFLLKHHDKFFFEPPIWQIVVRQGSVFSEWAARQKIRKNLCPRLGKMKKLPTGVRSRSLPRGNRAEEQKQPNVGSWGRRKWAEKNDLHIYQAAWRKKLEKKEKKKRVCAARGEHEVSWLWCPIDWHGRRYSEKMMEQKNLEAPKRVRVTAAGAWLAPQTTKPRPKIKTRRNTEITELLKKKLTMKKIGVGHAPRLKMIKFSPLRTIRSCHLRVKSLPRSH